MHFQIKGLFWDGFDYFNIHNLVSNDCFYDMSCIHESMQPSYLHKCVPTLSKLFHWHDDVMKWKHFPCSWPFVWGIHRSPVNFPHKGLWRGALMFSLICVWINGWVNNRKAGDLRRYRAHYDVTVMCNGVIVWLSQCKKNNYSGCGRLQLIPKHNKNTNSNGATIWAHAFRHRWITEFGQMNLWISGDWDKKTIQSEHSVKPFVMKNAKSHRPMCARIMASGCNSCNCWCYGCAAA